ncbi:Phage capsid scaffolding protein (GPO) serine peptidase [Mannheimia haemolytica]|uniref:GPO family capsid scaffolding protein n=1 Tax=Mannheimia haemolytica TaxID=75985 RepID=UPI000DA38AD6|nr:GPO family capsid scaffolding protein [Mannheimia haemolytica]SQE29864.1 Phage capsid scaffolding protein (GPO) serine peptidase [Mannheimia haemolytica]
MAKQSKFFRVAKAGATTDGRKISPEWIEQMAKHYNPKVFQARISIEHIKGLHPNSDFRNMGDVLALKTEKDGKDLYLLAQIAPTDELIAYTKAKQKNFTSIEVNPRFADTGEAYLVGLAVTDNPASLGTDYLEFAAKHSNANVFNARKTDPQNVIVEAVEFTAQWEDVPDPEPAVDVAQFNALFTDFQQLKAENAAMKQELEAIKAEFAEIEKQPAIGYTPRPKATGTSPTATTDKYFSF